MQSGARPSQRSQESQQLLWAKLSQIPVEIGGMQEDFDRTSNVPAGWSMDISGFPDLNLCSSHMALPVFWFFECNAMVFHKVMQHIIENSISYMEGLSLKI